MREARPRFEELGARVVAVAAREAHQAQALLDDGMPFPLLLDPGDQVRELMGATGRFRAAALLHPRGALAYARALKQARFLSISWSEATRRPGALVADAQLNITWTHIGNRLGDYPDLDTVVTELRRAG